MSKKTSKKAEAGKNIRQLFKLPEFWVGIALLVLSLLLGWGLPMIIPSTPHNGGLITLAGFLISIPFFIRAYQFYAHLNIKRKTWVIIIIAVIAIIVFIVTQLQLTQVTQASPELRVDFSSPSTKVYDNSIKFCVRNFGNSKAYQYRGTIFVAPADQLDNVTCANVTVGNNTLAPTESIYTPPIDIIGATEGNGVWYIYYKLVYNDSEGHVYSSDPYWLFCNFSEPQKGFGELTQTQANEFEAAIKARYTDENCKDLNVQQ